MKKILFAILCISCLVLSSCSFFQKNDGNGDQPKVDPPAEEVTTTGIKLVDADGNEVTSSTAFQETSSTAVYSHRGIYVIATLSNDKEKDVTTSATFSEVDLTKQGKVRVTVTYQTFAKEYDLEVVENHLVNIQLSLWATKLVYKVGETFSTKGLVVSGIYESGSNREVTEYSISIKDSSNVTYSEDAPFTKSDVYNVTVTTGTASKTYQIGVYSNSYASTETLNLTSYSINEHLNFDNTGTYTFPVEKNVFADANTQLSINKTAFKNKDVNGDSIKQTYQGTSYDTALELTAEKDMKLVLNQKTDLLLLVGGINGRGIAFKNIADPEHPNYAIGNVNEVASLLYISLPAGVYDVSTTYGTLLLYNIDFNH